jgi:nitrous oxidase accessory protein
MLGLMLSGLVVLGPAPGARVITVQPGGPVPSLTAALSLAADGDTIVVRPGDYREPEIMVARRVTIVGQGWPVFHGGDHQVLSVTADSVTIRGLVVRDVSPSATEDRAGIKVTGAAGCRIEDNTLLDTFFGIYLAKVTGCVIRGNRVRGSGVTEALSGNAIHSWSSSMLVIEDNVLRGHRDGIYFEFTTDANVRRNHSSRELRYGLHFMFSHGCHYTDNTFSDNRAGVAVMYSHDVTITGNRFLRSWGSSAYGLLLKEISDSRLSGNRFERNSIGLYAEGTNRVTVTGNEFLANGWGVQVMADAQQTAFRRNRFEGNSFDVSTNSVHAASEFSGNYWDRYTGYDLDRDGYGDVPFAPVRLFALAVQQNEPALILLRSFFVSLLDAAERVAPVLTPATMVDHRPLMHWPPATPTPDPGS